MKQKKVLFIISSLTGGGAERVTINLSGELSKRYDVTIATLYSQTDAYAHDEKVKVIRYYDFIAKLSPPVRKIIKGIAPRLMWVNSIKRSLMPDVTISMLRVPNLVNALTRKGDYRIVSERADPSVIGRSYYMYAGLASSLADHTVFQSRRVQNMFPSRIREKSSVILNPVNVDVRATGRKSGRIVTAGRLTDQKNHAMLLRAFASFAAEHPGYFLEIYGKGPLRDALEKQTAQLGLSEKVRIIDFCKDFHEQIRDAEMFVLSSDFEGLSNALLEAMMMGIPCISTDCAGSDEIIEDMKNGLLVPVGDEAALCRAMDKLAGDDDLRESIAEEGMRRSERFRTETVVKQWIELIEKHTSQ